MPSRLWKLGFFAGPRGSLRYQDWLFSPFDIKLGFESFFTTWNKKMSQTSLVAAFCPRLRIRHLSKEPWGGWGVVGGCVCAHAMLHVCVCVCVCTPCCTTYRIFVPQPGIESSPPSVEADSLNHWTTREFPTLIFFFQWGRYIYFYF